MEIRDALQDINIAFKQHEFANRLLSIVELGKIGTAEFDVDHRVILESGNLEFSAGSFSDTASIIAAAEVGVSLAFGATALVIDNSLDAVGVKYNPEASDNFSQLRCLIYMVRCAFAHGLAEPRWQAQGKYCRTIFVRVKNNTITIDLAALNNQVFDVEQIGGCYTWYCIRDEVVQILCSALPPQSSVSAK